MVSKCIGRLSNFVINTATSLIIFSFNLLFRGVSLIYRRKHEGLHVKVYDKDTVYLFLFPACQTIPCISPYALKLETWLRLRHIRYQAIRKAGMWSKKGQIPFIELNGEQHGDSNLILGILEKYFLPSGEKYLIAEQKGVARAIEMMLENSTVWSYFYYRYVEDAHKFVQTWTFLPKIVRHIMAMSFPKSFHNRAFHQGIGRNTREEIYQIGNTDLQALSDILGSKMYIFGDEMSMVDCFAFGHLTQLLYIPLEYPQTEFIRSKCPNLIDYVERIKDKLWPDWDNICSAN